MALFIKYLLVKNFIRSSLYGATATSQCLSYAKFRILQSSEIKVPLFALTGRISVWSNRSISTSNCLMKKPRASITFIKPDGSQVTGTGKEGETILDVVVNNEIDLGSYGICEGTLSCSTCHVIFKPEDYAKLPEKPTEEELDLVDMAIDSTTTSRLGCQVTISKILDGMQVTIPTVTRDARERQDSDSCVT